MPRVSLCPPKSRARSRRQFPLSVIFSARFQNMHKFFPHEQAHPKHTSATGERANAEIQNNAAADAAIRAIFFFIISLISFVLISKPFLSIYVKAALILPRFLAVNGEVCIVHTAKAVEQVSVFRVFVAAESNLRLRLGRYNGIDRRCLPG